MSDHVYYSAESFPGPVLDGVSSLFYNEEPEVHSEWEGKLPGQSTEELGLKAKSPCCKSSPLTSTQCHDDTFPSSVSFIFLWGKEGLDAPHWHPVFCMPPKISLSSPKLYLNCRERREQFSSCGISEAQGRLHWWPKFLYLPTKAWKSTNHSLLPFILKI